jgi:sensor histidine kinase YesM
MDEKKRNRMEPARRAATALLYTLAFNGAIALLLVAVGFGQGFLDTLIFSQCVGLTICICVMLARHFFGAFGVPVRAVALLLALLLGALLGTALGTVSLNLSIIGDWGMPRLFFVRIVGISMIFGLIITYFFYSRARLAASTLAIQEERIKRLSSEKLALEADLKRLQAQIEPHFLFNTLSNIVGLMESEPTQAKAMQLDLIRYLRTALGRTRNATTTLGEELELVQAYLNIFKIRMGDRLRVGLDFPETLKGVPFAPLLLQPIVENAVLHGLTPKIEGGSLHVRAWSEEGRLKIEVSDTGVGFEPGRRSGVGLTNVQHRLTQLFGDEGRLFIAEKQGGGVTARIDVPLMPFEN